LLVELVRRRDVLLPSFATHHDRLRRLPRALSRALRRRWSTSLAGLALALALGAAPALAATIDVTGACTLPDAIAAANGDVATGACSAGSGDDTIVLTPGSTHAFASGQDGGYGPTALPSITSTITIAGNGSTIRRDPGASSFRLLAISPTGELTLQDTTVTGGDAGDGRGGAIYNYAGTLTLTGSTISGNTANGSQSGYGGGIAVYQSSLGVSDSTVSGNVARGGGGAVATYLSPNVAIRSSTLSGNRAANYGGAVDNYRSALVLFNSTISGNTAAHGGGISNEGASSTLFARFNTISGNTAALGGDEVYSTPSNDVYVNDFNLFGHDGASGLVGLTPGATDVVPAAALGGILSPSLADNGGPTLTLALVAGSPAIDGSPAGDSCLATDQRGVTRPQGAACDIGAFETMAGAGEVCGNCMDDDGDGAIDLADADCSSVPLSTEKGTLMLKPDPSADQITLTATFPKGPSFNPRLEGATASFADAAGQIACVRIPPQTAAAPKAWKEKTTKAGTTWSFKDAKDGSLGDPTKDTFNASCSNKKNACTVKLNVKRANLAGDGSARTITTGLVIGDDAWKKDQAWKSKAKGKTLSTP
jgi:hypothetical protein